MLPRKADGSNNIMCGWFVGYAQPGKPKPCGRYENAIRAANDPTIPSEDMTKWMNVGIDKAISDTSCYPLIAGKRDPARLSSKVYGSRALQRTAVNWHERNTMCKQYMCLRQVGMGTREILGYEIYTDHDKSERSLRQGEFAMLYISRRCLGRMLEYAKFYFRLEIYASDEMVGLRTR